MPQSNYSQSVDDEDLLSDAHDNPDIENGNNSRRIHESNQANIIDQSQSSNLRVDAHDNLDIENGMFILQEDEEWDKTEGHSNGELLPLPKIMKIQHKVK